MAHNASVKHKWTHLKYDREWPKIDPELCKLAQDYGYSVSWSELVFNNKKKSNLPWL